VLGIRGWPQNQREFLPLIEKLAAQYRFIVPDLRGLADQARSCGCVRVLLQWAQSFAGSFSALASRLPTRRFRCRELCRNSGLPCATAPNTSRRSERFVPCSPVVAGAPAVMKTLTILTGCTPIRRSSWPVAAYPIPPSIAALRPPRSGRSRPADGQLLRKRQRCSSRSTSTWIPISRELTLTGGPRVRIPFHPAGSRVRTDFSRTDRIDGRQASFGERRTCFRRGGPRGCSMIEAQRLAIRG